MMENLMTICDLAKHLQISEITIRRWCEGQKIPAIKIGKQWRFEPKQIEMWKNKSANDYSKDMQ